MNALNEVNKVITSVSYYLHRHGPVEEEEWLTAERMAVRNIHYYHYYLHQKNFIITIPVIMSTTTITNTSIQFNTNATIIFPLSTKHAITILVYNTINTTLSLIPPLLSSTAAPPL